MPPSRLATCFAVAALLATLLAGCGSDSAPTGSAESGASLQDVAQRSADVASASTDAEGPPQDVLADASGCPQGHVTLTMSVDDSANQTYGDGELLWTGSFAFDAATNSVAYATAWQPTDGPYPPLWDDGPISEGGHEAEGQAPGDHIFSVAVCYAPEQDRLLSYGVLNEDLRWIWLGPNGLLDVPGDADGQLDADGLVITAHGDRDIELTLDLAELHPDYASIDLDTHAIYLKGSMNAWTPVQLLDNGALGDPVAGDGRLTYRHSYYAHGHIGLLRPRQEAQFVFVFALGDLDPDLAAEYKVDGEAATEGTAARMHCLAGWLDAVILQSLDSKGVTLNTALEVCPEDPDEPLGTTSSPDCDAETPCPVGQECQDGTCALNSVDECGDDAPCPAGEPCVNGDCVVDETTTCETIVCGDDEVCVEGACVPAPEGECSAQVPCAPADAVCVDGVCVVPTSSPELLLVVPATGSALGGTAVSLQGSGFDEGAVITFGDGAAETLSFSPSEIVALTPSHPLGSADVTVTNPDGASSTYPGGFTFVTADSAPVVTALEPISGPSSGGTAVSVFGAHFAPGAVVRFGTATATATTVAPDGASLSTLSPEAPLGTVAVTVVNPDGQEAHLSDAFTYSPNLPDWGQLHPPASITAFAEVDTITLSAEVYEATVTDDQGPGFGVVAEAGYGPIGTLPAADNGWTWYPATFTEDVGNNDIWAGSFSAPEGSWSATMRFSLGSSDTWLVVDRDGTDEGLAPDQLISIEASPAPAVAITSVTPDTSWLPGGAVISLGGVGLSDDCTATMDGVLLDTAWEADALQFVAPARAVGDASLLLSCPDGTSEATLPYVESWDGALSEWPEASLVATNTLPSSWGEDNALRGLYVAADATHLYVAVDGQCYAADSFNAIVIYIDTDLGSGTGVTMTSTLSDSNHAVDAVLSGVLEFTAPGFGAEAALATLNMTGHDPEVNDPIDATAGWRGLSPSDDFPWLVTGAVYASPTSVEARLPLESLFGPPNGETRELGLIVRITNGTGDYTADQSLPEGVAGDAFQVAPSVTPFTLTY